MTTIRPCDRAGERSNWRWRLLRRTLCLPLITIVCGLAWTPSPRADALSEEGVEYGVKLAFIYNLTKFVEWPSSSYLNAEAPLLICIVGDDPFDAGLEEQLRARNVEGHPVEIRKLRPGDAIGACQIVFIPLRARDQAASIVMGLKGSSTLTVGETKGFAVQGGIINFAVEGNRVHLEVNPIAAKRAGLTISSRLLNIATIVKGR